MQKRKFIVNNKEYELNINVETYEKFIEIRDKVNPEGEYKLEDIKYMKEAVANAYNYDFSIADLNRIPIENLIFEFIGIDAFIAQKIEKKLENLNLNFNQDK